MLTAIRSSPFKRDVKRLPKRGKDMMGKLRILRGLLIEKTPLPEAHQDHRCEETGRLPRRTYRTGLVVVVLRCRPWWANPWARAWWPF